MANYPPGHTFGAEVGARQIGGHIRFCEWHITPRWVSLKLDLRRMRYTNFHKLHAHMVRAHYIVRVGNDGLSRTVNENAPNHWYYLSPQHLWGFPTRLKQVNVRAKFEAEMKDSRVTVFIWFLCNSVGGPGRFVQVGIAKHRSVRGPVANAECPIPPDMMAGLRQGFDHWFEWRPVSSDAAFHNQLRQIPVPLPHYIPTLRYIKSDHTSFPAFQALIDGEVRRVKAVRAGQPEVAVQTAPPAADRQGTLPTSRQNAATVTARTTRRVIEVDLENIRRENVDPHAPGHVYLIRMEGTSFHKIGMSLDPEIRLRTLQTGNPQPLSIVNRRAVQDMRSAELSLHRQFETQRVPNPNVREWFDFGNGTHVVNAAFDALHQ